jgi:2'-5' RNA ligase
MAYNEPMRTFIGMKLEAETREKIASALKPFKKIATPIKWVKPENWHLTMKFIGEVNDEKKDRIIRALNEIPIPVQPFEIVISGFGKFGRGDDLNIFWAGIEENQILKKIYLQIEEALEKIQVKREDREFRPHLTIGRNRKPFNFKPFAAIIEKEQSRRIASFIARGFQIFQSILTPEGPIYNIVEEISFPNA